MSSATNRLADRLNQLGEYRRFAQAAQRRVGKSPLRQAREILALREMGGQCGISDYYWYRLYDDGYQQGRGAADFLGWRLQQKFSLALNPRVASLPGFDKISFYKLAAGAGLPLAPVHACYYPGPALAEGLGQHLRSVDEVGRFLRDAVRYPLFVKPSFSQQGVGTQALKSYDKSTDSVLTMAGKTLAMDELLALVSRSADTRYHRPACGCLFQPMLESAPEIIEFNGWPAVCGARVVCLNEEAGVRLIRAIWKVAVRPNSVDNFSLGKYGNLVADIDLDSGRVSRMIGGMKPESEPLALHPQTGKSLDGFCLPRWAEVVAACRKVGPLFPLMHIQHWDVAFTADGPCILELNDLGATEFLQLHGHGLLTPQTRQFLRTHGDAAAQPWVQSL
ncbi:sugar-transfer associated ATP-grasp domain-containing protein [Pelomonas sp. SE-A7]|uniref:sugar-transfer associated ATP-grasp domain-containing protein n=1 Tax=Pelomonas sp. SE-A7 TaxID=3054953 RepID=UPI00259C75E0|nr:sugar-transfer associated ATP-grasp domain-containing protein [Pelomonas sp. SE-A7]MDM4764573.1 sugar-transfer associated ATP-grasp domain-containing protein [Pelomonas sp. SE-A7]